MKVEKSWSKHQTLPSPPSGVVVSAVRRPPGPGLTRSGAWWGGGWAESRETQRSQSDVLCAKRGKEINISAGRSLTLVLGSTMWEGFAQA